jgi:hypothetical protein
MSTFGQAPAPETLTTSSSTATQLTPAQQMAVIQLQQRVKSGANWFYWIAGLSVVNTIAAVSGTSWRFILGLGITQVSDAIAQQVGGLGTAAAIVIDAIAIGFFVLMGKFAGDAKKWAFILGMVAFGLDGLLSLLAKDFISLAFHAYALFCIYRGFAAVNEMRAVTAKP